MIVTTAGRTNQEMIDKAKTAAALLQCSYVDRNKRTVKSLITKYQEDVLVAGKERYELFAANASEPFFFHPSSAMFRIKRLQKEEHDPFVDACNLTEGKSLFDCTLGLASDSIIASFAVGKSGAVEGVEASPVIAFIVKEGLAVWQSHDEQMDEAMRRVKVTSGHALDELRKKETNSIDCVYLDPMFEESIDSDGIKPLKHLAVYEDWTTTMIEEARRVAKERVVLKDHYKSTRFEAFGFQRIQRKTAKFHYGIIEL
ncbi:MULTISPECIES: class I SAM-dependent methyltransferase [Bacillaceae]|uniref:class I SAM-dependent methyltransferase n=1 Tax=Bacillaceae TaxID=186817 RepID=UPI001E398C64|nr:MULTISPECIES: class I SAM-dependent methyltransferase [Bacillaceae]MCE4047297.1 class I SAM-dependent methyltransferase [Bacillus sp. Au-Bac7]MDL0437096.1 class I SAM-dependent methyltransferase [Niallia sp. SS-2023]UPO86342.1 class I SAM-dependent methyltransferase [Niallia sp. Man26]